MSSSSVCVLKLQDFNLHVYIESPYLKLSHPSTQHILCDHKAENAFINA